MMKLKTGPEMTRAEAKAFYQAFDGVKDKTITSAMQCPYTPMKQDLMNAWLQGYSTATEELEQAV